MRKSFLSALRKIDISTTEKPLISKPDDVLVRMTHVGVCGSDVHYYSTGQIGSQVVEFPFTLGHEGSGIVEAIGNGVKNIKVGDRVAIEPAMPCWKCDQCIQGRHHTCRNLRFLGNPKQAEGCLQDYMIMPDTSCFVIPDNLSLEQAALVEPLSIGIYAVQKSIEMTKASVGILGFGPIGMSVMIAASSKGATEIYVSDKLDYRLNIAKKEKATGTFNPTKQDVPTAIAAQQPLLLDVVFECCGQQEAIDNAIDILKPGGKLMVVGIPEFDRWSFPVDKCRHKEITVFNVRRQNNCVEPAIEQLASGAMDLNNMITHRFDFKETDKAFKLVDKYDDGVMKAIIAF